MICCQWIVVPTFYNLHGNEKDDRERMRKEEKREERREKEDKRNKGGNTSR